MKNLFIALMLFMLPGICNAQMAGSDQSSQLYIETDPTVYFFNGYSLVISRSATFSKRLKLGIGVYKTTLPDFYIESEKENIGLGWKGENFGFDGFIDYYLFAPNKGLSVGAIIGLYKFTIQRNGREESYNSLVETIRIGYLWRPFKSFQQLYLNPWAGLSTDQKISGTNEIDGSIFHTPKWSFVPALQIGFSF